MFWLTDWRIRVRSRIHSESACLFVGIFCSSPLSDGRFYCLSDSAAPFARRQASFVPSPWKVVVVSSLQALRKRFLMSCVSKTLTVIWLKARTANYTLPVYVLSPVWQKRQAAKWPGGAGTGFSDCSRPTAVTAMVPAFQEFLPWCEIHHVTVS